MVVPLYQNPSKGGGWLGWSNCSCTVTAMMVALETANARKPTAGEVRSNILEPDGRRDVTGGTTPSQNVAAAKRAYGVTLDRAVMPFDDAWRLGASEQVIVSISISYAPISGTRFDASPGFRGLHQIALSGGKVYDPLADGRRTGIPKSPQAWPKSLVMQAAGLYGNVGRGRAAVIIAKAPKQKPIRYSVSFEPGAFFIYGAQGGRVVDPGFSQRTSAPCSAPFTIPWPPTSTRTTKRVVEVAAGRLLKKYVEPTATHLTLKESR